MVFYNFHDFLNSLQKSNDLFNDFHNSHIEFENLHDFLDSQLEINDFNDFHDSHTNYMICITFVILS